MVIERNDELEVLPGEVAGDPLRLAIGRLILTIFDLSAEDSPARGRAIAEAMAAEGPHSGGACPAAVELIREGTFGFLEK